MANNDTPEKNIPTEISTSKTIEIDKNDIANIAIAEAELKIRRTIKGIKEQLGKVENELNEKRKLLNEESTRLVTETATAKAEKIEPDLYDLNKKRKWKFSLETSINAISDPNAILRDDTPTNTYAVELVFENKTDHLSGHFAIERGEVKLFPAQITLAKEIMALIARQEALIEDSLNWRHKMADIPSMERQIRAAIAKRQISQTKDGQALIDQLLKSLDSDIKMLGI